MRKFEMTEADIADLWKLARAGEHPHPNMVTDKLKEIGFTISHVENGHGGYNRVHSPRWFYKKAVLHDMMFLFSKMKLYDMMTKEDVNFVNMQYARYKNSV